MKKVDTIQYNLHSRVDLRQDKEGALFIVVDRKSRIIMKDGHRILEMVNTISREDQSKKVSIRTSAPVCSKTKKFLLESGIVIKPL